MLNIASHWLEPRQQKEPKPTRPTVGFRSPDGTEYRGITNVRAFCREHNLAQGCMHNVTKGRLRQYKGWTRIKEGE